MSGCKTQVEAAREKIETRTYFGQTAIPNVSNISENLANLNQLLKLLLEIRETGRFFGFSIKDSYITIGRKKKTARSHRL